MQTHNVLAVPRNLWKDFIKLTLLNFLFATFFDVTSFLMQFSKESMVDGKVILAIILICLYYLRQPLQSFSNSYLREVRDIFNEHLELIVNERASKVLLRVKGKVIHFNEEQGYQEKMSNPTIMKTLTTYIHSSWKKKVFFIDNGIKILSSVALFVGLVFSSTLELENTSLFILFVILSATFECFFSSLRIQSHKSFSDDFQKVENSQEEAKDSITHTIPLNDEHIEFLTCNLAEANRKFHSLLQSSNRKNRGINVTARFINAFFTIGVICLKTFEVGLQNNTLETLMGAIALASIYSQFTERISTVINIREQYSSIQEDLRVYSEDFNNINAVYQSESKNDNRSHAKVLSITIPSFRIKYDGNVKEDSKPFELFSPNTLKFFPGDFVFLKGPNGSGKSTLMQMITGNLSFNDVQIDIQTESNGYAKCVIHQDKQVLGSRSVLEEITFGKANYDREKLLEILKALHLYDELSERSNDLLEYLNTTSNTQYSSGQQQRLALARTLLNVDETTQIIAFDEAINNLNDEVALQVLQYIRERYKNCIVLFATHQVGVIKQFANRRLEFTRFEDNVGFCVKEI